VNTCSEAKRSSSPGTRRRKKHLLLATLCLILTAPACAGGGSDREKSSSKDQTVASASPSAKVPNPFKVIDRFTASSLGLHHPVVLAVGPTGNVYVTEADQEVAMISPAGKVLRRWGKAGSGPGEFNFTNIDLSDPSDVHAFIATGQNGRVYVSDSGNYRIEIFSATGRFIRQFGSQGLSKGQFQSPNDLAVDSLGNVYVADEPAKSISKFSPTGDFIWRIGGFSSSDPDLLDLGVFASVDSHGRLVVVHADDGTVLYIDGDGHTVDKFEVPASPCDVTVDHAGNTFMNGSCGGQGDTAAYDRTHSLVGVCSDACPLRSAPRFGPDGEAFAFGKGGAILKLRITLP
jgi:DNA-binding beta-propeller fold protein YncE